MRALVSVRSGKMPRREQVIVIKGAMFQVTPTSNLPERSSDLNGETTSNT